MVALPIVIAALNLAAAYFMARQGWRILSGLAFLFIVTCFISFIAALPYINGFADSTSSFQNPASYQSEPYRTAYQQFQERYSLFNSTLGNFSYLLALFVLDVLMFTLIKPHAKNSEAKPHS